MTKSRKQRNKGFWTVSRARMVETMTALRKEPPEIADALGCSTEMVVDFLLGQAGTEHEAKEDRLFYMVAMAGGRGAAMAKAYHVFVQPKDKPEGKEWVEEVRASKEGEALRDHIQPMLPPDHIATSEWAEKPVDMPTFDQSRLRETPDVWPEEEA